jgi:predicted membrane-bound spermidine synthase
MLRLTIAFGCSGFAALLCQTAWQRMLGIFAGSDTVSAALVVGAFLAGLGLGSLLGAQVADRLSPARALLGFALVETGVAAAALASPLVLHQWLAVGLAGVVDAPMAIFALCFAGLVVPTTLMGASLPLLARAVATSLESIAARIGWLYGVNTFAAGLGALAGGWLILGHLGFERTLWVAAALDLVAVGLALSLWRGRRGAAAPAPIAAAPPATGQGSLPLWCGLVFVSGYVIVALEILWVRVLGQVGQFHAYLFPTVLGVFLLADGAGTAVAAAMLRRLRDPRPAFFLAQSGGFVAAGLLLLGLWLWLPHWPLAATLPVDEWRLHPRALLLMGGLTLLVVGPPAFLVGMTFPFVQRAVQRDLASVGARVGWVQLANILGNAAGSLLTGLVALHWLGTAGTLRLLAVLSLLLALAWLLRAGRGARGAAALAAAGCAAVLLLVPGDAAFWRRMHAVPAGVAHAWAEDRSGVAFWRGREAPRDPPGSFPFFIMGHHQATIPFEASHLLLGAAGALLHPAPRRVFALGVGSGGTPWGAALPGVEELRAVELVAPVLEVLRQRAAAEPAGVVAALLADPRLRLEAGDGRRALARSPDGSWDIIQADAIYPETSHSGLLYSREYLDLVRRKLAPGGLAVQWAPSWRVVETFLAVFPHVVMLRPGNVLVGSDRPVAAPERLPALLRAPEVMAHLARGNPQAAARVPALAEEPALVWGPAAPRAAAPLTDLFPRDEFFVNNPPEPTYGSPPPARLPPPRSPGTIATGS